MCHYLLLIKILSFHASLYHNSDVHIHLSLLHAICDDDTLIAMLLFSSISYDTAITSIMDPF